MFLGSAVAVTVPVCLSIFILVRRAERYGYFIETPQSYSWNFFNPFKVFKNLRIVTANYDMFGFTLWNFGNALLLLAIAIPPHETRLPFERPGYILGGSIAVLAFGIWEIYATDVVSVEMRRGSATGNAGNTLGALPEIIVTSPESMPEATDSDSQSGEVFSMDGRTGTASGFNSSSSKIIHIVEPEGIGLQGSKELDESTRITAIRLEQMSRKKLLGQKNFRNICQPILSAHVLWSGTLLKACVIVGCSSFAFTTVSWVLQWNPSWIKYSGPTRGVPWLYWVSGVSTDCSPTVHKTANMPDFVE